MPVDAAAFSVLCGWAREALAAEEGAPIAPVPATEVDPAALLKAVVRHRAADLLWAHRDLLDLPPMLREALAASAAVTRTRVMVQTLETVGVASRLTAAGIDTLVIKGVALAALTTGRADARGPGDVDLLIRPEDLARAHQVLTASGWALDEGGEVEPGTWAFRHVNRWGSALTYRAHGVDVDLHWRLEITPGAFPSTAELWQRREQVQLGGGTVATIGAYDALRHSAGHREGWCYLRTLVDLRRLARVPGALDGPLRPVEVTSLALARVTVGLPAGVPAEVAQRLDRAPVDLLERASRWHLEDVPKDFGGGAGSAASFRNRLATRTGVRDLEHTLVALVLPAHAALPVRARTAWVGIPAALLLRATRLVRALVGRFRRDAPCAEQPGPAA